MVRVVDQEVVLVLDPVLVVVASCPVLEEQVMLGLVVVVVQEVLVLMAPLANGLVVVAEVEAGVLLVVQVTVLVGLVVLLYMVLLQQGPLLVAQYTAPSYSDMLVGWDICYSVLASATYDSLLL